MADEQHITSDSDFFLGEDKILTFTVRQSDEVTPQDITGWAISWMLKRDASDVDASAIITKEVGTGVVLTTPASGVCTVTLEDTDTATLPSRLYYHELKRTDDGFETVLAYGTCHLGRGVHR
jgi:hypothetical protein